MTTAKKEERKDVNVQKAPDSEASDNQIVVILYLLYRCNVITRISLKKMLGMIKVMDFPKDIIGYLAEEAKKC